MSSSSSGSVPHEHSSQLQASSSPLDTLLPYLIASKRSLSTIEYVYKANELCASTRAALETSAVTRARTSFLRSGVDSQITVLRNVQEQTDTSTELANIEYYEVLEILEEAEKRLRSTLQDLKDTIVEARLRPEDEQPRNLLDFVHEDGVEKLVTEIRGDFTESAKGFEHVGKQNDTFQKEVQDVTTALESKHHGREEGDASQDLDTRDEENSIADLLADMEDRAKEMAQDLESLVTHYDMCVRAIKHTEGGGDAALQLTNDLPEGVAVGQHPQGATPESISDEEKADLMRVLQEDAAQVEEVVTDIKNHITDIETTYQQVEVHLQRLAKDHESVNAAFKSLETIGQNLPGHVTRNQAFLSRWMSERRRIEGKLEELENAKGFYDGFVKAYHSLIIEVGRRKTIEERRNKLIQETRLRLDQLYEEDAADRERFKDEQGEFLPVDIWAGIVELPAQYNVLPVEGRVEKVPDISKSVIHKAIRRVHGSGLI